MGYHNFLPAKIGHWQQKTAIAISAAISLLIVTNVHRLLAVHCLPPAILTRCCCPHHALLRPAPTLKSHCQHDTVIVIVTSSFLSNGNFQRRDCNVWCSGATNVFPLTHNHHLGFPLCHTPPTSTSHIMLIVASLPLRHQHIDANHLTAPSPHQRATTTTNTMTTVPCQQRPAQRPKPRRRAAANAPMTPQHVRLMSFGAVFAASVMVVRVIWRMRGWFYYCRWYKKCVGIKMQHPLTNKRREVR